jgi:hypothetical protein
VPTFEEEYPSVNNEQEQRMGDGGKILVSIFFGTRFLTMTIYLCEDCAIDDSFLY